MTRDENQKYRLVPQSAEESIMMQGYDLGFNHGYLQAKYDNASEEEREMLDKVEQGLKTMFSVFNKPDKED